MLEADRRSSTGNWSRPLGLLQQLHTCRGAPSFFYLYLVRMLRPPVFPVSKIFFILGPLIQLYSDAVNSLVVYA
jgi:hypothetical protein